MADDINNLGLIRATQVQVGNAGPAIFGIKFNDRNADGIRQTGEEGLPNFTILLEPAPGNDGSLNRPGEFSVVTDANGAFSFTRVAPGNYTLTEIGIPAGSAYRVTTTNPLPVTVENSNVNVLFGNTTVTGSRIVGCKYLDVDNDGFRDGDEPGIKNVRIFLDGSNGRPVNGQFDPGELNTLTRKDGEWSFDVQPGTYKVREERVNGVNGEPLETNFPQSTPPNNVPLLDVTVAAGETFACAQVGDTPLYQIEINKFRDLDRNGQRNLTNPNDPSTLEPSIAKVPFILDLNGNGRWDQGSEPITTTDINGVATFSNLRADTYPVLEIFPSVLPIESLLPGVAATPENRTPGNLDAPVSTTPNPVLVSAPGPQARFQATITRQQPVLVQDPTFVLQPQDPKFVDTNRDGIQEVGEDSIPATGVRPIFASTAVPFPPTNPDPSVTYSPVRPNSASPNLPVGNTRPNINVFKYADLNADGKQQPGEPGIAVKVYIDLNLDGTRQENEPERITNQATTNRATGPTSTGGAVFEQLVPGDYVVREELPQPALNGFTPSTPVSVPVSVRDQDANVVFGNTPNSSITGCKFDDLNNNAYKDGNEKGIANVQIYLDINKNGIFDSPDVSTTTDQFGTFAFTNLSPGTYSLREVAPAGSVQTTPPLDIILGPNQNFSCALVGNSFLNILRVPKFQDINRDGIFNQGDLALPNIPFLLDLNRNGRQDPGEQIARSDEQGFATFTNLQPGSYSVLELFTPDNTFPISTGPNPAEFVVPGPNSQRQVPTTTTTAGATTPTNSVDVDLLTGASATVSTSSASEDLLTNGGSLVPQSASGADSLLASNATGTFVDTTKTEDSFSSLSIVPQDTSEDKKLLLAAPAASQVF